MGKRAEIETRINGTDVGIRDLGGLENAFERLGKTSQSTGALLRDMHKEWSKPTAISTSIVKMGAQVLGGQIRDAASAIAEPAKTSYAQALAKATEWRDATQRIATSTGQGYAVVGEQVNATAQRLGLLPGRVQDYSRSVRQLTGDWQGAMGGLDAYQNRALKTDRTLEELIPTAATLATTFGLKSTDDVNRFFGTLDRQAKNAGMSAEIAERAFMSASGSLAMLTNAKPAQLSALTTGLMAEAPTPEMGMSRIGAVGGLLQNHMRYVEARMRKQGKLGKGEHLYDEQGQLRGDKMFDALEFVQGDMAKFYGTKDRKELIGRIGQSGMMSMQDAAGLMNLDVKKLRAQAAAQPNTGWDANATASFLSTEAGKRTQYDARKDIRDIGLGSAMLPAQDVAVAMGGGAAGVAIASAGSVMAKAADTFWGAVEIFAGKAAGGAARAAAGTAAAAGAGAAGGGAGTAALTGTLGAAAVPLGLGLGALGVGAGVWYAAGENDKTENRNQQEREAAQRQGFASVGAMKFARSRMGIDAAPAVTETGRGYDRDRPLDLGPAQANPREMADAIAKALASQTLRVQSVAPPSPPPGQTQPL
jgi:hypothetical protein